MANVTVTQPAVEEGYICGECYEFYTDPANAVACCAPTHERRFRCDECYDTHQTADEAKACCLFFTCGNCGDTYGKDEEDKAEACCGGTQKKSAGPVTVHVHPSGNHIPRLENVSCPRGHTDMGYCGDDYHCDGQTYCSLGGMYYCRNCDDHYAQEQCSILVTAEMVAPKPATEPNNLEVVDGRPDPLLNLLEEMRR